LRANGADRVVLLGNSGGASLMAAYHATGSSPGDAFVSLNAHPGRPEVFTSWLDPSVTDESDPRCVDASLDMYDARNGPPYDPDFVDRYRAAQRARNQRITAWARAEIERGERLFTVARLWADLRFLDLTLDPSDREPGCYLGDPRKANRGPLGVGAVSTLRTWLNMWSLDESPCLARPHLACMHVPALVIQSTADQGCYPSDAHAIHDAIATPDKRLEFVPGDHYLTRDREDVARMIAEWAA
jgi:pimeloyl-ACP methyl ester carboxylesterase